VSILRELGAESDIAAYTNFMRADLEAMTQFHETGQPPVWREFFAHWNAQLATGERSVPPFEARPVGSFQAVRIEKQAILQQQESPLSSSAGSSERMPAR
jgi:hypothetical protein